MVVVDSFLIALLGVVVLILQLYIWVLIVDAVLSWLTVFDVINSNNRFVATIGRFSYKLTEPVLRPLRRIIPVIGGLDLSPLVLIFAIIFLQSFLLNLKDAL